MVWARIEIKVDQINTELKLEFYHNRIIRNVPLETNIPNLLQFGCRHANHIFQHFLK